MKHRILIAATLLIASQGWAEDAWRWTDARGTVHYTNERALAPEHAASVETTIATTAAAGEPRRGGIEIGGAPSEARPVGRKLRPIYDEERMRFGCFTAGVLTFGGWSHANDITPPLGCYRYLLGPEAWLNTARAELAVREHGLSPRELYRLYRSRAAE